MEGILMLMGLLMSCTIGLVIGFVGVFAAVRSSGNRLQYINGAWSITRLPRKGVGTMRSMN